MHRIAGNFFNNFILSIRDLLWQIFFQMSSTNIEVCINEISSVMKDMMNGDEDSRGVNVDGSDGASKDKDLTSNDLCLLKTMFLEIEKVINNIQMAKRFLGHMCWRSTVNQE